MRPLKLTISAFASYSGRVELDMEQLGTNGIYLITGDTGSGKTTIFDAISFALFGEPSGNMRNANALRSEYAPLDTPTFVELSFQYREEIYTVKRNPVYMRKALRGEGVTQQNADATLTLPDGKLITGVRNVDVKIEEILGINRSQFCQIAMIAQGDFMKILHQDTAGRGEIFRKIFQTDNYKKLQEKIKELTKEASENCTLLKNSVNQYIDDFSYPPSYPSDFHFNLNSIEKFLELSCEIMQADENEKEQLVKALETLDNSITDLSNRIQQVEKQRDILKNLEDSKKLLESDRESKKSLHSLLEEEKLKVPAIEEDKKRCAEWEQELKLHDEYKTKWDETVAKQNFINETKTRCENGALVVERTAANLEELRKELQSLENVEAEKVKIESDIQINNSFIAQLTKLNSDIINQKALESSLKAQQKRYLDLQKIADESQGRFATLNRNFLQEQAGIMAENLLPGQPCPVCGSLSHPILAQKTENAPTEAQLKQAEVAAQGAQQKATEASQKANEMRGNSEAQKRILQETLLEIFPDYSPENESKLLEDKMLELQNAANSLKNALVDLNQRIARKEKVAKDIVVETQNVEKYQNALTDFSQKLTIAQTELSGLQAQLEELKQKMKFASKNEVQQEIEEATQRIERHEKVLKDNTEKFQEIETRIAKNEGVVNALSQQIIPDLSLDIEQEKLKLEQAKNAKIEKQEQKEKVSARLQNNSAVLQNVDKKRAEAQAAEAKLTWLQTLSNTANGKLQGRDKISLETFVQMTYFEKIIRHANKRLEQMSGGQYRLVRARTEGGNAQVGLDLNVHDTYSGKERSVKTLSGGESFMAALSLALGLSDEIQVSAGGVQIDTTFVDEGFGSLDDEALQLALRTLQGLAQNNHLIGIISHVNALKNIEKKIVVTKTATQGSVAKIL